MTKLQKQEIRVNTLNEYAWKNATHEQMQTLAVNQLLYMSSRRDIIEAVATITYICAKQNKELTDILEQLKD